MNRARLAILVALAIPLLSSPAMAQSGGADPYRHCTGCHKSTGLGFPGFAPPLASHLPDIEKAPGGRAYLIDALLYGLKGEIQVKGQRYQGTMPAFGNLDDAEAAAVLNLALTKWGNDKLLPKGHKPIAPGEIKAQRGKKLTPEQVYAIRGKLGLK